MKKLVCFVVATLLALQPIGTTAAISGEKNNYFGIVSPTPTTKISNQEEKGLATGTTDYEGRVKEEVYQINGDEWKVVMKIGVTDVKPEEGMSDYEVCYEETFVPAEGR